MSEPYRKTLFDRLGPDAGAIVKVAALSPPIFLLSFLLSAKLLGSVTVAGIRIGWLAAALVALLARKLSMRLRMVGARLSER